MITLSKAIKTTFINQVFKNQIKIVPKTKIKCCIFEEFQIIYFCSPLGLINYQQATICQSPHEITVFI